MTTWTQEQKNIVPTDTLFNQVDLSFNQTGIHFGGIINVIWTLVNKNT